MFCPRCRAEYREGFVECSDCRVPLVGELPPGKKKEYLEFVTVFSSNSPADIAVAKSILESAEMHFITQGEGSPYPLPADIQVAKDDEPEAKKLLEEL